MPSAACCSDTSFSGGTTGIFGAANDAVAQCVRAGCLAGRRWGCAWEECFSVRGGNGRAGGTRNK
jgi:hypothetical protein